MPKDNNILEWITLNDRITNINYLYLDDAEITHDLSMHNNVSKIFDLKLLFLN